MEQGPTMTRSRGSRLSRMASIVRRATVTHSPPREVTGISSYRIAGANSGRTRLIRRSSVFMTRLHRSLRFWLLLALDGDRGRPGDAVVGGGDRHRVVPLGCLGRYYKRIRCAAGSYRH